MYHRGMKWEQYLEHQAFKDDIVRGLERQTNQITAGQKRAAQQASAAQRQMGRDIAAAQQDAAREVAAAQRQAAYEIADAQERTRGTLNQGFGEIIAGQEQIMAVMEEGLESVTFSINRVAGGIEALHTDFNWAMGAVLWKMEMQQNTLHNILDTLQAPLDTAAKELRKRAEDAYLQGWYDEALIDFLASEEKNYQDFAVHQAIGNIYLYQKKPADLDQARDFYLKAGKYATPRSAYYAALGYMHAGFVCYLQKDDKAAVENAKRATEIYPKLTEAFFNHAKFAAAAGQPMLAIPSLEVAIRTDRNYAIKAHADADFEHIGEDVFELMTRLRAEVRGPVKAQWQELESEMSRYAIPSKEQFKLENAIATVKSIMAQNTYFCYLDAPAKIDTCRMIFTDMRLPERDRLQNEATELLHHLREVMANHAIPDAPLRELNNELLVVEQLLDGIPTYVDAMAARDKSRNNHNLWQSLRLPERDRLQDEANRLLHNLQQEMKNVPFDNSLEHLNSKLVKLEHRLNDILDVADVQAAYGEVEECYELWIDAIVYVERATLEGHASYVRDITFNPDGALLASASGYPHNTIRIWDVNTGQEQAVIRGHTDAVQAIAFSPDGTKLVSASRDNTVILWDLAAGTEGKIILEGDVTALFFTTNGSMLAAGPWSKSIRLWDVKTGLLKILRGHTDQVQKIAFSPDGATLASGSDDETVRIWDVNTGEERMVLRGHTKGVRALAFSPDGTILASISGNWTGSHETRLWNAGTGEELAIIKADDDIAFNSSGAMLAVVVPRYVDTTTIQLWDVITQQRRVEIEVDGERSRVEGIVFSPEGGKLAVSDKDNYNIRLWQPVTKSAWEREKSIREREKQQLAWREAGCCDVCGKKLSLKDKLRKQSRCNEHF